MKVTAADWSPTAMPARRASSDNSPSANRILSSTGIRTDPTPGIHPIRDNPGPAPPVSHPWPPPAPTSTTRLVSGGLVCTSSAPSWRSAPAAPAGPWTWPPPSPSSLGGALLLWSAYVHFHLWSETDGYRSIPTIGPLFLLQSIAGLVIGIGVVVVRRLWAAVIGIGFALSTIAGFLLSVAVGLFGFKDSWLAPFAKEAFIIEILAAVVFVAAAALCLVGSVPRARAGNTPVGTAT